MMIMIGFEYIYYYCNWDVRRRRDVVQMSSVTTERMFNSCYEPPSHIICLVLEQFYFKTACQSKDVEWRRKSLVINFWVILVS